jgi:hypothetical protein
MAFSEIADKMRVQPEVLAALGVTADQMAEMGLRSFIDLATGKGFDVSVDTKRALEGDGKLSVTMSPPSPGAK